MFEVKEDGNGFYYVVNADSGELARYTDENGTNRPAVNLTEAQANAIAAELNQ